MRMSRGTQRQMKGPDLKPRSGAPAFHRKRIALAYTAMAPLTWLAIAASGLVFGQLQNFGTDPEEKKRGERMLSQGERGLDQNEKMVEQQRILIAQNGKIIRQQWIVIAISGLVLIITLIALLRR